MAGRRVVRASVVVSMQKKAPQLMAAVPESDNVIMQEISVGCNANWRALTPLPSLVLTLAQLAGALLKENHPKTYSDYYLLGSNRLSF